MLAGERATVMLKIEHLSGAVSSMFLLEKQFRFECENREKSEFRNNPLLKFTFLSKNEKQAKRPDLKTLGFTFHSHAHALVSDGKF